MGKEVQGRRSSQGAGGGWEFQLMLRANSNKITDNMIT